MKTRSSVVCETAKEIEIDHDGISYPVTSKEWNIRILKWFFSCFDRKNSMFYGEKNPRKISCALKLEKDNAMQYIVDVPLPTS